MAGIQSLFDVINAANPDNPEVVLKRRQAEESQVRTKTAQVALENQAAFQRAMSQLYPMGGPTNETFDAAASGDIPEQKRIQMLEALYAQYSPQHLPQLINARELSAERRVRAQGEQQKRMGAIFAAIKDAGDYEAAMPDIMENGGLQRFGLTGNFAVDSNRIEILGNAGMTAAQQSQRELAALREADRVRQQEARNAQRNANHDFQEQVHRDLQRQRAEMNRRAAAAEERRREAQEDKDNKAIASARNSVAKVTKDNIDTALLFLKKDERSKGMPDNMLKLMARDVAQMAKNDMARSITEVGDLPSEDQYSTLMDEALKKLSAQGKFVREYNTFFGKTIGSGTPKYKAGRGVAQEEYVPPTRKPRADVEEGTALTPEQAAKVDAWMARPKNKGIPREEIIRQAMAAGLL